MAFLPLIGKALTWLGGGSAAAKGLGVVGSAVAPFLGKKSSASGDAYGQLAGAFKAADDHGLHRLAVAGSPAGYSPAPSAAAEGMLAASQSLGRGTSKKENQLLDAQIAEARSRTILNEANARRTMAGPQPGLGGASIAMQDSFDRLSNGGNRSISREPERDQPGTQTVTLGNRTGRGPNPEAFEVGLSELIAGGLIYGPQWLAGAVQDWSDRQSKKPDNRPKTSPSRRRHY